MGMGCLKIRIMACVLFLAVPLVHSGNNDSQWIVVSALEFWEDLTPLCEYRKNEGLVVLRVRTTDVLSREEIQTGNAEALKKHLQKLCSQTKGEN